MAPARIEAELRSVFSGIAAEVPPAQAGLDAAYLGELDEFRKVLEEMEAAGMRNLARALAPRRMVCSEFSASVRFHFAESREAAFQLGVRMLNMGYRRRFAYSAFVENRIEFTVKQVSPDGRMATSPKRKAES